MHFSTAFGLAASIAGAQAVFSGFNYGATKTDGTYMQYNDYMARFQKAQSLPGGQNFDSARLYTMIQGGSTTDPSSAFQAAIDTQTSLLLGIWCSAGQETVTNEITAMTNAIEQLGDDFTSLVVGISVGSEDLYRITPTGIMNKAGVGAGPDELTNYIQQVRKAISGTSLSGASIGHVDTWTAWQNGSNIAVIENVDWLGMDTYPYFQTTVQNDIGNANQTFWDAFDVTAAASNGKPVWVTETGWPVSGAKSGLAVASVDNAETYWQEVGCSLFGQYNTWWYTLEDSIPTTPNPSFGIIGSDLNSQPLYDLKCKAQPKSQPSKGSGKGGKGSSSSSSAAVAYSSSSAAPTKTGGAGRPAATVGRPDGAPTAAGLQGTSSSAAGSYASATGSPAGGNTTAPGYSAGSPPAGSPSAGSPSAGSPYGSAPSGSASAGPATGGASQTSSAVGAGILAIFALISLF